MIVLLSIFLLISSTFMYFYLHRKTRMNLRFLYIDNLIVTAVSFLFSFIAYTYIFSSLNSFQRCSFSLIIGSILIIVFVYSLTMIRFWRTPIRKVTALEREIVSPADGNIIYIKRIEADTCPVSIKNGQLNKLSELTKTTLLKTPCWLIGINMTLWDVHKNCAPVNGKVILVTHTKGVFLSLKKFESLTQNERNTFVIENKEIRLGVVQIASKGVRRIDSYIKSGADVSRGEWMGMIRFGSQVDVILPDTVEIKIVLGQQVYAAKTVIGKIP